MASSKEFSGHVGRGAAVLLRFSAQNCRFPGSRPHAARTLKRWQFQPLGLRGISIGAPFKAANNEMRFVATRRLVATAAIFVAMVCGPTIAAKEADWSSNTVGGSGGEPVTIRCPAGSYLGGIQARIGDDMDSIGPICVQALTNGQVHPAGRPGNLGGSGGRPREFVCPRSAPFVRDVRITADGARTLVVDGIAVHCGPLTGPMPRAIAGYNSGLLAGLTSFSTVFFPGFDKPSGTVSISIECPSHMAPVGLHGRAGAVVDALGLVCGEAALVTPRPLGKVRPAEPSLPAAGTNEGVARGGTMQRPGGRPIGKVRPAPPAEDPPICQRAEAARGRFNAATQAALDAQCRNARGGRD